MSYFLYKVFPLKVKRRFLLSKETLYKENTKVLFSFTLVPINKVKLKEFCFINWYKNKIGKYFGIQVFSSSVYISFMRHYSAGVIIRLLLSIRRMLVHISEC